MSKTILDPALAARIHAMTRNLTGVTLREAAVPLLCKKSYAAAYKAHRRGTLLCPDGNPIRMRPHGGPKSPLVIPVSEIYRFHGIEMPTRVLIEAEVLSDGSLRIPTPAPVAA